jgi:hypothetical protein
MASPYLIDYDTLLARILADYQNLDPSPDITKGSPVFIKASCLASAIWGIYRFNDWNSKQQFPDKADTESLNHWGSTLGLSRATGETDAAYSSRIISLIQQPSAGGTAQDYKNWALAAVTSPGIAANLDEDFLPGAVDLSGDRIMLDGTANALGWVQNDPIEFTSSGTLPSPLTAGTQYYSKRLDTTAFQVSTSSGGSAIDLLNQGTGLHQVSHYAQTDDPNNFYVSAVTVITPNSVPVPTAPGYVTVVLVPNDESILDSSSTYYPATAALTTTVTNYIEARRPVTAAITSIGMESTSNYSIIMSCSPVTVSVVTIQNDVLSYINGLTPGAVLYKVQIEAIALRDGATNASVTSPTFDVYGRIVPDSTTAIRSDSITINLSA